MTSKNVLRVWLTISNDNTIVATKLLSIHAHKYDIALVYDSNGFLNAICGFETNPDPVDRRPYPSLSDYTGLPKPINLFSLFSARNSFDDILPSIMRRETFLLSDDGWMTIRKIVTDNTPQLLDVINRLERRQWAFTGIRVDLETMLFNNLTQTYFKIFNSRDSRLNDAISLWHKTLSGHPDLDVNSVKPLLFDELESRGILEPIVEPVSAFIDSLDLLAEEEDYIRHDLEYPGLDWERRPTELRKARYLDKDGRELNLVLAHRSGYRRSDLLGADLIYTFSGFEKHVFVQYKIYDETRSFGRDKRFQDQLQNMLDTCQVQGCTNYVNNFSRKSNHIRLSSCPVYFKFIKRSTKIMPDISEMVAGDYLQSCLVQSMIQEFEILTIKELKKRSLTTTQFASLLRQCQIGSDASAFVALQQRIALHIKQSLSPIYSVGIERDKKQLDFL